MIFAEIRDSEGQSEPALQLLEISLGEIPRGFESLSLRQMAIQVKKRVAKAALFILQFSITGFQTFLPILKKSKWY